MNNASQKGFTSLTALFVTSLLLSIGGPGALFAYGRHSAEDFRKELHEVLGMTMQELPGLPGAPAIYASMDSDAQIQSPPTPTPTPTPLSTPTPTPTSMTEEDEDEAQVMTTAKIDDDEHENDKRGEGSAQTKVKFFMKVKD